MMSWPSSTVDAIGFSTSTWMPRSMQVSAISRCRWVGAAMVTASTPRSSSASTSLTAGQPSAVPTKRLGAVGIGNADQAHAGNSARTRAWFEPMVPTPMTPIRKSGPASLFAACNMKMAPSTLLKSAHLLT